MGAGGPSFISGGAKGGQAMARVYVVEYESKTGGGSFPLPALGVREAVAQGRRLRRLSSWLRGYEVRVVANKGRRRVGVPIVVGGAK